jgi:hypothetical protein
MSCSSSLALRKKKQRRGQQRGGNGEVESFRVSFPFLEGREEKEGEKWTFLLLREAKKKK